MFVCIYSAWSHGERHEENIAAFTLEVPDTVDFDEWADEVNTAFHTKLNSANTLYAEHKNGYEFSPWMDAKIANIVAAFAPHEFEPPQVWGEKLAEAVIASQAWEDIVHHFTHEI